MTRDWVSQPSTNNNHIQGNLMSLLNHSVNSRRQKVFCIGFPKTGTMSIGRALIKIGYKGCPMSAVRAVMKREPRIYENANPQDIFTRVEPLIERFNSFRNNPWTRIYRECEQLYPNSKFILTVREPQAWLKSYLKHQTRNGNASPDEIDSMVAYTTHNESIINYFRDKPEKLLVLQLEEIDWSPICNFLGRRTPLFRAFPHRNKTALRGRNHLHRVIHYEAGEVLSGLSKLLRRKS